MGAPETRRLRRQARGEGNLGTGGAVHLGADNSGDSTSSGESGNAQPNVRLGAGDTSSGNAGNQQAAQGPNLAGGSKPDDTGIATVVDPKGIGTVGHLLHALILYLLVSTRQLLCLP